MSSAGSLKNHAVLAYLQRQQELPMPEPDEKGLMDRLESFLRRSKNVPWSRKTNEEFLAAIHAEHELRLRELAKHVPDARLERVLRTPALVTPTGRIFAIMGGTFDLMLYLPRGEKWGREYPEIGEPWRRWYASARLFEEKDSYEQHLASMLRLSYSTAMKTDAVV